MAAEMQPSGRSNATHAESMHFLCPLAYEEPSPVHAGGAFPWDLSAACGPLLTAFHYISGKLACHGLHVALVVKSSRPEILPAWPIGIHTQHLLAKIIQKANEKYPIDLSWLKALLDLCNPIEASEIFESQRAISYTVHRSLVQKDVIYSGEGLTVLAIDCIYAFKSLLADLGAENSIPLFRDDCKESCIALLKHVNMVYRDIVLSKGYLRRAYTQFVYSEDVLDEVCEAYRAKFGSEALFDAPITMLATKENDPPGSYSQHHMEQLQASPRKLPVPDRHSSRKKAAQSARAALSGPCSVHVSQLEPPFQEPSTPTDPELAKLDRPKSPKGSLFESPRSPPVTPPRSARLRTKSKSANLRAASATSHDSSTLVDQNESPPAARLALRRRAFTGPLFGFPSSDAPSDLFREPEKRRGKSFDLKRSTSVSRSRSLKPSPEIASRASSTSRSVKSTISRLRFPHSLSRLTSARFMPQPASKFEWEPSKSTFLKGAESKFGWLHVMGRKNSYAADTRQQVF